LLLFALATTAARADELSSADKLRVAYSTQFAWTREGLPVVTVRVADGRSEVVLAASNPLSGVRLLPDGEGGPEVHGGATWTIHAENAKPSKVRWHIVVAHARPGDPSLQAEMQKWRERGFAPRTFEVGTVFGIRGEVLDSRKLLVAVDPHDDEAEARAAAKALKAKFSVDTGIHPELAERPRGTLIATDERGTQVRNDSILWFAPEGTGLIELRDVDKEGGGRESRRYFGKIYVTLDAKGGLTVVNAVPEDRLLAGLVPAEMMPTAPTEALKAQAVAARNELLAKIGTRHLTDPYRLCATQHCQVYAGAGRESERATNAVNATRGELLVRADGSIVDAVYSASCGGHTEDNDRAWGGVPDPSLRGRLDGDKGAEKRLAAFERVDDKNVAAFLDETIESPSPRPFCARPREAKSNFRWTTRIDVAKAEAAAGVGALKAIELAERGVSGRVVRMKLVGESGEKEIHGELEVRRALGGLKSALFVLDVQKSGERITGLTARGGGHGHGIGMCQVGAVGMAEGGSDYKTILLHYYGAAHVKRLY
jgi:SpoIID/LytB domain protein